MFILFIALPVMFFWALLAFAPPSQALSWGERLAYEGVFAAVAGSVFWLRVRNR